MMFFKITKRLVLEESQLLSGDKMGKRFCHVIAKLVCRFIISVLASKVYSMMFFKITKRLVLEESQLLSGDKMSNVEFYSQLF